MSPTFAPKTLAIDYGLARVGLAVSHGSLAEPLKVVPNTGFFELLAELEAVIKEHSIRQLVVGISAREMAEHSQQFVAELRKHLALPIFFADEAYSTKAAAAKLYASPAAPHRKKGPVDHYAAAEFLQEWLEEVAVEAEVAD